MLEACAVSYIGNSVEYPIEGLSPQNITVLEQSTGLTYRGNDPYRERPNASRHARVALSYVTGTHAFKGGINHTNGWARTRNFGVQPVTYRFNNSVPNQITQFAFPFVFEVNVGMGAFAGGALLVLFGLADEGEAIKRMPWGVMLMVCGCCAVMCRPTGGFWLSAVWFAVETPRNSMPMPSA